MATLNLYFVRETDKARLYRNREGSEQWVPRSVCTRTVKFPGPGLPTLPVHEVAIADWWLGKNPWPSAAPTQQELI